MQPISHARTMAAARAARGTFSTPTPRSKSSSRAPCSSSWRTPWRLFARSSPPTPLHPANHTSPTPLRRLPIRRRVSRVPGAQLAALTRCLAQPVPSPTTHPPACPHATKEAPGPSGLERPNHRPRHRSLSPLSSPLRRVPLPSHACAPNSRAPPHASWSSTAPHLSPGRGGEFTLPPRANAPRR